MKIDADPSPGFPLPQSVLQEVPFLQGRAWGVAPLENTISLNNRSYRVTSEGEEFLLRLASPDARWLGVRRDEEIAVIRSAAEAGISPPLLYVTTEGHLLMPFLQAHHWTPEEARQPSNIVRIAHLLRRLHSIRCDAVDSSIYRRIERILESATTLCLELPANLPALLDTLHRREHETVALRLSRGVNHNDLWLNNFLDDGENLWLVDWEFAGTGSGVYDLATITMAGQYDAAQKAAFLAAYGSPAPISVATVESFQFEVYFFEAVWALVQHRLRGLGEMDYQAHARKMFERLNTQIV